MESRDIKEQFLGREVCELYTATKLEVNLIKCSII